MPRPPSKKHPLRVIRTAAGLTQEQFARLVGVSRMQVQKIELGERTLTDDLAVRIAQETGCMLQGFQRERGERGVRVWEKVVDPKVPRQGRCPVPLRDYSKADFDAHRKKMKAQDPGRRKKWLRGLWEATRLLLAAAERAGKFDAVAGDLQQLIGRSVMDYQLQPQLVGLLRDSGANVGKQETMVANFIRLPASTALEIRSKLKGMRDGGCEGCTKGSRQGQER